MDGFALRSSDVKGATRLNPIELKLVSVSSAGSPTNITLKKGERSDLANLANELL